ncbi:lipopolysaccharide biosynthesis protein [Marinibacterium profundimaris]|uniref:Uncharacterized protein n=1 Tax=Marinibacterium profundimaris TaxID=1679460 RepID=A0A225NR70_9RHOB|nr:polysaccharide biosynthesis C-terminal domain-containing protein [Marinibacterium profundimaris]OWU77375.1 hypothetical protein ATO3_01270 [Marinibacterium profundimaris]
MTHLRTRNYLTQVKWSGVFKIVTTMATLLSTSLLLNMLGPARYGTLSLILSLQAWIVLFDLGIGKGLRNHVARSLARDDLPGARAAIGTAYALFGLICLALAALSLPLLGRVDWAGLLNAGAVSGEDLRLAVISALLFALAGLWVGIVTQVCGALQRSALPAGCAALNTGAFAVAIGILALTGGGSLALIVTLQGTLALLSGLLLTLHVFRLRPDLRPRGLRIGPSARTLLHSGGRFLSIQLCLLLIFATDKLLVARLLGTAEVAQYDVVFKIFALLTTGHLLVVGPLWSAFTEAYHRDDTSWIRRTLLAQGQVLVLLVCAALLLAGLTRWIVGIWIGDGLAVDGMLPWAMAAFAILLMWNNLFGALLNGIGALRAQVIASALGAAVNIPLSILLVRWAGMGVSGIVLATALSIAIQSLMMPLAALRALPLTAAPLRLRHWRVYLRKLASWP